MALPLIEVDSGGVRKSLALWGFTNPVLTHNSQSKGGFTVRVPGVDTAANPPIPYYQATKVFRNGAKIFQGRQVTDRRTAKAGAQGSTLAFADAWYDLSNLPFQQLWTVKVNGAATTRRYSRYNLFVDVLGNPLTNGAQVGEVIDYAISCGVAVQKGTMEPSMRLPIHPARAMMCSEVILLCLQSQPDAVTYLDHSTDPPTFNCRLRGSLASVTMPYKGRAGGVVHLSSNVAPRPDLLVPQVVIDYKNTVTETLNGSTQTIVSFSSDAYPAGSTGQAVGAIVLPVDLSGITQADVSGVLTAVAFDPTNVAWWKTKHQHLNDGRVTDIEIIVDGKHPITVLDPGTQNVISTVTYPNELVDGSINPWMKLPGGTPVAEVYATVSAWFSWKETDQNGIATKQHNDTLVSVKVKLTNSPPGQQTYSALASFDAGETAPPNLALNIYNSLQPLQYEGEHTVMEETPSQLLQIVGPWLKLNLSGGDPLWVSMGATVQSAVHDFFAGQTTISFGPAKHLAPGDLVQLLIWARFRLLLENPSVRTTGVVGNSGGKVDVGDKAAKENSTSALSNPSLHATTLYDPESGSTANILHDADAQEIQLSILNNLGIPDWSSGGVSIKRGACLGADGLYHKLEVKELTVFDANCNPKKQLFICSDPY